MYIAGSNFIFISTLFYYYPAFFFCDHAFSPVVSWYPHHESFVLFFIYIWQQRYVEVYICMYVNLVFCLLIFHFCLLTYFNELTIHASVNGLPSKISQFYKTNELVTYIHTYICMQHRACESFMYINCWKYICINYMEI